MARVPAADLNTHVALGDIELVVDDEHLLGAHLVGGAELGDGSAARVHIRLRLDQHDLALAALGLGVVDLMTATSAPSRFFQ